MLFVGIDTSNYTTSAALCDAEGNILANVKKPLPVGEGACGLRQSDAVFAHIKNLPEVMERLGDALRAAGERPVAVGVSSKPRDAADSYMPCFLSGVAAAKAFAAGCGIPLFEFSHQQGHIMASYHTSGADAAPNADKSAFFGFHISGGTTEIVRAEPSGSGFCVELIGQTLDCNAGQIIDRTGVMLGLQFPCGPQMEKLADERDRSIRIPKWKTSVRGTECNLSGLQNLAGKCKESGAPDGVVCAAVFDFIGRTLFEMAQNARAEYGELPIVLAGGVMSNRYLKKTLSRLGNVYFTEPQYSADNAAGTAFLCRKKYLADK